jgi:anaphase-promoting complex subunit 2
MSVLYEVLPPEFSPALSTYIKYLFNNPGARNYDTPLAMPTLISFLERFDPLLFGLVYEEIESKVQSQCKGDFENPKLQGVLDWVNGDVLRWITGIYDRNSSGSPDDIKKMLKPTFSRFEYHIHKTLAQLRTTELFQIIIAYPRSSPALEDIKVGLRPCRDLLSC